MTEIEHWRELPDGRTEFTMAAAAQRGLGTTDLLLLVVPEAEPSEAVGY
jgi:hypothetical protein